MTTRAQWRNAVVGAVTGLTTTATRVYQARADALPDDDLPGLIVLDPEEVIEDVSPDNTPERQLTITIAAHAKGLGATLTDLLDTMSSEVETAIEADATVASLGCALLRSTEKEFSDQGEQTLGRITLTYLVYYV